MNPSEVVFMAKFFIKQPQGFWHHILLTNDANKKYEGSISYTLATEEKTMCVSESGQIECCASLMDHSQKKRKKSEKEPRKVGRRGYFFTWMTQKKEKYFFIF